MRASGVGYALLAAAAFAACAAYTVPRGIEARSLIAIEDDPVRIADRALDQTFDAARAQREIEAALAANDTDMAGSMLELAGERHVAVDSALADKVKAATAEVSTTQAAVESFALGLVSGEPKDMTGLAGTTLGDLFVFGDIRDAVRESARLATGEQADTLILGLACVGLAITAGTYATLGAPAPARIGLSAAKVARKTGKLGEGLALYIGRLLRQVVDWNKLKTAIVGASLSEPALAIHAAREAVKVERAGGLVHLARDVGTVQAKAGTQAALDGLKIAEGPREMSRLARLSVAKGGKTRAILKVIGRGAIALTVATFDLGIWILGALVTVFGFVSALKSSVERTTLRVVHYRKRRRLLREQQRFAALTVRGP